MQIDLSVVIVTYNAQHLIGACLDSLQRDCIGITSEVFVVDNGSGDGTVALLRQAYPWVRLIEAGANLGFSAGNNRALALCAGQAVMLLNPDTVVHTGAVPTLLAHLARHADVGAVGPQLRLADGSIQHECARRLPAPGNLWPWLLLLDKLAFKLRAGRPLPTSDLAPEGRWYDHFNLLAWPRDRACAVQSICGACMLLRRSALQQVGLLDEASAMYLDDIDYCRRVLNAGWAIHYQPASVITHLWQQSSHPQRAGDHYALGCHAIWLYLGKHHGAAAAHGFAATAALAALLRWPAAALLALLPGAGHAERVRRLRMSQGLAGWALRWHKRAPRFGFVGEKALQ